jgi:hypothetical protein
MDITSLPFTSLFICFRTFSTLFGLTQMKITSASAAAFQEAFHYGAAHHSRAYHGDFLVHDIVTICFNYMDSALKPLLHELDNKTYLFKNLLSYRASGLARSIHYS